MDTYRPSIFELLAADSLKTGLRDAIKFLINGLKGTQNLVKIVGLDTDEIALLVDLIIEFSHLRTYNAAYSENFYHLFRVHTTRGDGALNLGYRKAYTSISLISLVILPYLKTKLDKHFERLSYRDSKTTSDVKFLKAYRYFTKSYSLLNLICIVRYAVGASNYHNPVNSLVGIVLAGKISQSDIESDGSLVYKASKYAAISLGKVLTLGSLLIQFLDYYNSRSNSAPLFVSYLPTPNAPSKERLPFSEIKYANICPLCNRVRQNECVLSNTGYVFCYSCIQNHVESNLFCPITGNPTSEDNIVRLL